MKLEQLKLLTVPQLVQFAYSLNLTKVSGLQSKQDIILEILHFVTKLNEKVYCEGILEITNDGYGFIRSNDGNHDHDIDKIYVSPNQIKRFYLRTGDYIEGEIRAPREKERWFALTLINKINGEHLDERTYITDFDSLTPIHALEQLKLEHPKQDKQQVSQITPRLIDFISPIGKGQRALIVAPPKAGKTELIKNIAYSISKNHPDVYLIILLIDERPEEVTDMQRTVQGEVIASTFDEPPERHVQVAEIMIERAKRLVEQKMDVVILLDSITRLARAYNNVTPSSGRILSGGIDATALHRPKRFFGAARNIESGGSLTIIATALVETGSKMDDVIYEEFKGTGNMELHLNRRLAERRIFPAVDVLASSTRKDDLLLDKSILEAQWEVRKYLHELEDDYEGLNFLINAIKNSDSNAQMAEQLSKTLAKKS